MVGTEMLDQHKSDSGSSRESAEKRGGRFQPSSGRADAHDWESSPRRSRNFCFRRGFLHVLLKPAIISRVQFLHVG